MIAFALALHAGSRGPWFPVVPPQELVFAFEARTEPSVTFIGLTVRLRIAENRTRGGTDETYSRRVVSAQATLDRPDTEWMWKFAQDYTAMRGGTALVTMKSSGEVVTIVTSPREDWRWPDLDFSHPDFVPTVDEGWQESFRVLKVSADARRKIYRTRELRPLANGDTAIVMTVREEALGEGATSPRALTEGWVALSRRDGRPLAYRLRSPVTNTPTTSTLRREGVTGLDDLLPKAGK